MNKKIIILCFIFFLSLGGCTAKEERTVNFYEISDYSDLDTIKTTLTKTYAAFSEQANVGIISKALEEKEEIPEVLNVLNPNFLIEYIDGSTTTYIFLWLNDSSQNGLIVYADDINKAYNISSENTSSLIFLLYK